MSSCRGCPSDPPCRGSPPWLPSGSNGDTPSRRGRRLEHAPVRGRGWILPASCVPPGGGGRRRRPGVDLNPAILGKGCRFVQPHSGLGRWGCPESRDHRLRVQPGTRCRAGDGAWNMSPFCFGVLKLCDLGALCGQSLPMNDRRAPPGTRLHAGVMCGLPGGRRGGCCAGWGGCCARPARGPSGRRR